MISKHINQGMSGSILCRYYQHKEALFSGRYNEYKTHPDNISLIH